MGFEMRLGQGASDSRETEREQTLQQHLRLGATDSVADVTCLSLGGAGAPCCGEGLRGEALSL